MSALAETPSGAKCKVVAAAHIRVEGGLDCSLVIIGPAAGVKFPWIGMPLGIVVNTPNSVCEFGGLLAVLGEQLLQWIKVLTNMTWTYHTFSQTAAPLGIL